MILLSPTPCKGAVHLPVIQTVPITDTIELGGCEAVIFTSKTTVSVFENLRVRYKHLKLFSVGAKTSRAIIHAGGTVYHESSGADSLVLAQEIIARFLHIKFFYPKAETPAHDIESVLRNAGADITAQAVYKTVRQPIDTAQIPHNAVIIFTAPSTVTHFLAQAEWRSTYTAVALGQTTAAALAAQQITAHISQTPAISDAVNFANTL